MKQLPAGMRNNNPGNIKYIGQAGTTPSANLDQGDPQAVYKTPEEGMRAMYDLLMRKYTGGKLTPRQIIAANMGWTPGNTVAAENIAKYAGIGVDDDINLKDPKRAAVFMRALMKQEHGDASNAYTDDQINAAISGGAVAPAADQTGNYATARADTPSSAKPTSDTFKLPPVDTSYGDSPSETGGARFGGTGLGTPPTKIEVAEKSSPWAGGGNMPAVPGVQPYTLPPVPAAVVAKAQAAPMVNTDQQMAQRQQLAMLLQTLNANKVGGGGMPPAAA